eukprot:scaffold24.g2956.t1
MPLGGDSDVNGSEVDLAKLGEHPDLGGFSTRFPQEQNGEPTLEQRAWPWIRRARGACGRGGAGAAARRPRGAAAFRLPRHTASVLSAVTLDHPVDLYEAVKMVIMTPVATLVVLVLVCWAVTWVVLRGAPPPTKAPLDPLRSGVIRPWVMLCSRILLFIFGFYYIPVKGWGNLEAARQSRSIILYNHESYADGLSTAVMLGGSSVTKSAVARIPLIGMLAVAMQNVFVKRRGSRDPSLKTVLKNDDDPVEVIATRAADERYPLVMIAPEGTTKDAPCLLKFQRGAFAAGRPVCPVLVRYHYKHFNPGWGITHSTLFHLFRMMCQFVNFTASLARSQISMEILPPYFPSEEEKADSSLYAANSLPDTQQLQREGISPSWRGDRIVILREHLRPKQRGLPAPRGKAE